LQELKIWPVDDVSTRQFVKELGKLRELRIIRCTIHVRDESMERDLLESLANLHKIRTLCILGSALARGITGEEARFVPLSALDSYVWNDSGSLDYQRGSSRHFS